MKKIKTFKKIFFACLVFCCAWRLNAQTEFAPIGAEWYYNFSADGNIVRSYYNRIVSEKDTIIEGSNCHVLKQYSYNSNIASEKYILKQDQGKVYYYHQEQFNLLFDFVAEENDIIEFAFKYKKHDYNNFPFYVDTILSARYQVESITTNSQNLKTFTTKILEEDIIVDDEIEILPWYYSYTEKIGYYYEFMPVLVNLVHTQEERYRMLRCYSDDNFSYISEKWDATSFPCDYSFTTIIYTPKDEIIKIYPNPFSYNIFVLSNNGGDIEIIDISGKVVYNSVLSNGINEISTTQFLKGFYFVKIQNINSIQIFKIIKS